MAAELRRACLSDTRVGTVAQALLGILGIEDAITAIVNIALPARS